MRLLHDTLRPYIVLKIGLSGQCYDRNTRFLSRTLQEKACAWRSTYDHNLFIRLVTVAEVSIREI